MTASATLRSVLASATPLKKNILYSKKRAYQNAFGDKLNFNDSFAKLGKSWEKNLGLSLVISPRLNVCVGKQHSNWSKRKIWLMEIRRIIEKLELEPEDLNMSSCRTIKKERSKNII